MSYTPPAGNAANFSWVGVAPYTPPAGDAANFSWVATGVTATCAGALGFSGAAAVAHGVAVAAAGALAFTGACAALHLRYEVRGEVRLGGVLVNRRVRCSKRATGELMGQANTVAGVYRVHAGFDEAEVYVTAIDTAEAATDWIPPTANRLVPVLASDTA